MCTYETRRCAVEGSGKTPLGWVALSDATVYCDHPVHAQAAHTLNIDLTSADRGPSARVAVELEPAAAVRLIASVADVLLSVPDDISGLSPADLELLRGLTSDDAARSR